MNKRDACIALNLLNGIGYNKFKLLEETFGSIEEVFSRSKESLAKVHGLGNKIIKDIIDLQNNLDRLEKEKELADKGEVRIITFYDDEYPSQLKEISDPPICLYIRGKMDFSLERTIAVVGSRRITHYGREMANFLASELAYSNWTVVSGLAYGIDVEAQKAVINAEGKTVAVLGGGLARLHPQDHIQLARDIVDKGGAVITEFPMEYSPTRKSFPMRNRIISGLSKGVIIVEAGDQSGALITANYALEQGRNVFAVPGNANSPMSKGTNRLIKQGAKLTENIDDIFEEFEILPNFDQLDSQGRSDSENSDKDIKNLSENEQNIIKSIELEDKSIDQISVETNINMGELLPILMDLEMKQFIKQIPGKRYKKNN